MQVAVLLPPRLGIREGQAKHVLHHHHLEAMLFVNMPMLVAILIPMLAAILIPMAATTRTIRAEATAMAIKEARVVATVFKMRAMAIKEV